MIAMLEEVREFRRLAEVLFIRGWAEASAGNISLRLAGIPATLAKLAPSVVPSGTPSLGKIQRVAVDMTDLIGDHFLVTASSSRMRDIADDPDKGLCLIQVLDSQQFWLIDGPEQLSSEWPTHAGLHSLFKEKRSGERAVVHCHPPALIALSHMFNSEKEMNDRIFRIQYETRLFIPEMLGLIPFAVSGSKNLAKASKEKLKKYRLAIWEKHGVIASGKTLGQALDRIEIVEKAAAIYLQLKGAGVEPEGLSDAQIAETLRANKK
jgi:rhamnulose-1-phosphate aldolase